jgi:hypothetical protein
MLFSSLFICGFNAMQLTYAARADVVSNTEVTDFGANVNANMKNICDGGELEMLTICAREVLGKLDDCKPNDSACECCALQSMKRDCLGLCPNTVSGNFLVVLYDDCKTMNDGNVCDLSFKTHSVQDVLVAKLLRPNVRLPVEEKEPGFVSRSVLVNSSNESTLVSNLDHTNKLDSNQSNTATYNMAIDSSKEEENGAYVSQCRLPGVLESIFVIFIVFSFIELF